MAKKFQGGWPVKEGEKFRLSDGSEVEGEKEAVKAQAELPWPRPFPSGGFVTSDRYRFVREDEAQAHQERKEET